MLPVLNGIFHHQKSQFKQNYHSRVKSSAAAAAVCVTMTNARGKSSMWKIIVECCRCEAPLRRYLCNHRSKLEKAIFTLTEREREGIPVSTLSNAPSENSDENRWNGKEHRYQMELIWIFLIMLIKKNICYLIADMVEEQLVADERAYRRRTTKREGWGGRSDNFELSRFIP